MPVDYGSLFGTLSGRRLSGYGGLGQPASIMPATRSKIEGLTQNSWVQSGGWAGNKFILVVDGPAFTASTGRAATTNQIMDYIVTVKGIAAQAYVTIQVVSGAVSAPGVAPAPGVTVQPGIAALPIPDSYKVRIDDAHNNLVAAAPALDTTSAWKNAAAQYAAVVQTAQGGNMTDLPSRLALLESMVATLSQMGPPPVTPPPVSVIMPPPPPEMATTKTIRVVARAKKDGQALPAQARYWIGTNTTGPAESVTQFTGAVEIQVPLALLTVRVHSAGFKPMTRVVDLRGATPDIGPGVSGFFRGAGFLTLSDLNQAADEAPLELAFDLTEELPIDVVFDLAEEVVLAPVAIAPAPLLPIVEPMPVAVAPAYEPLAPAPIMAPAPLPAIVPAYAPPVVPTSLPPTPAYVPLPVGPPPIVTPIAPPVSQLPEEFMTFGPPAMDASIISLPRAAEEAPLLPVPLTAEVPFTPAPRPTPEVATDTVNIFGLKLPKKLLIGGSIAAAAFFLLRKKD